MNKAVRQLQEIEEVKRLIRVEWSKRHSGNYLVKCHIETLRMLREARGFILSHDDNERNVRFGVNIN